MKRTLSALALALFTAAGACSRHNASPADSALNTDLSLAAQQHAPYDSLSAAEQTPQANALTGNGAAPAPVVHHTSSSGTSSRVHHSSSGSSARSSGSSGGTVTTRSSSSGTVVKHTQRDAAIGAVAGAVIGATTSHSKVKGGIIGAAVGGILGGVIGNNVDKTKKKP
ncbi:MAG TPA: YMGG-like glycine zipper-containing protein [Gemmatimonadaceae bacterium]|nr:YMGG-like glycine zipper-containing protein [Gemmatimonadaceae bacterium]